MMLNGKTDVGKRRRNNQDSFVTETFGDANVSLALVCDGMGGANGGNIASRLACDEFVGVIRTFFEEKREVPFTEGDISSLLAHAAAAANTAVFRQAESDKVLKGMGTTLVCALICAENDTLYAANVGDSRLYIFSNGHLRQITRDHSLVQYLLDSGRISAEDAKTYPNRNVITRAIGIERTVEADIFSVDRVSSAKNALFLLCSDGLSGSVSSSEIEAILQDALDAPVYDGDGCVQKLIDAANDAGGPDNITAILINPAAAEDNSENEAERSAEVPADKVSEEIQAEDPIEIPVDILNETEAEEQEPDADADKRPGELPKEMPEEISDEIQTEGPTDESGADGAQNG